MSFLGEIKRRKVFQVAAVYLVVAWLIMQVVDVVNDPLSLPDWFDTVAIMLLAIGFPIALITTWAFEITPEGVLRDAGGDMPGRAGNRNLEWVLIALLVVAVGWIGFRELSLPSVGPERELANSVAVLPFGNLGVDDEDARAFADGMHGELITQLAKIGSLTPISRTSVLQYRDTLKSMVEIGEDLGVATVLEGNVQRGGGMVQVTASLIDAATDTQLWADSYNRNLSAESIFSIQRDMATAIASALQATLTPEEVARLDEVPTRSDVAWDYYRRGDDYFWRSDFATYTPEAIRYFELALAEDENFALAWAALSRAHIRMYWQNIDRTDGRREEARWAVDRSFELSSSLPETRLAMGVFNYMGYRAYASALADLEIAEAGMPVAVELFIARADIQRRQGAWEESLKSHDRVIELDPRSSFILWNQATTYLALREYDQAELGLERALRISPDDLAAYIDRLLVPLHRDGDASRIRLEIGDSLVELGPYRQIFAWVGAVFERDYAMALQHLADLEGEQFFPRLRIPVLDSFPVKAFFQATTYDLAGDMQQAQQLFSQIRTQLDELIASDPENHRLHIALGYTLACLGEDEAAVNEARRATELFPMSADRFDGAITQLDSAFIFARAGEVEAALQALDVYLANPGIWSIKGLSFDPRLELIREDPRFLALLERYE